jgi:hypothetical protein
MGVSPRTGQLKMAGEAVNLFVPVGSTPMASAQPGSRSEAEEREKRYESQVPLHVNHLLMEVTDPRSGKRQRACGRCQLSGTHSHWMPYASPVKIEENDAAATGSSSRL